VGFFITSLAFVLYVCAKLARAAVRRSARSAPPPRPSPLSASRSLSQPLA
jgi:hypothetical protein